MNIKTIEQFKTAIAGKKRILLLDFDGVIITPRCLFEFRKRSKRIIVDYADPLALSFVHHWVEQHDIFIMPFTTHAIHGEAHCYRLLLQGIDDPKIRMKISENFLPVLSPSGYKMDNVEAGLIESYGEQTVSMNRRFFIIHSMLADLEEDQKLAWIDDVDGDSDISAFMDNMIYPDPVDPNHPFDNVGPFIQTNPTIGITIDTHNTLMKRFGIDDNIIAFV